MQSVKEEDKKFDEDFIVSAPSANMVTQTAHPLPPGFFQQQSQQRPTYQVGPQMVNNMGQPQTIAVQNPQGVPHGSQMPTPIVYTIQHHVGPSCFGILIICILDLVLFIAPTLVSLSSSESGSLAIIIIVGFLQIILPITGIVCCCGEIIRIKLTFLQCYMWYRMVIGFLIVIAAIILLSVGFVTMSSTNASDGSPDESDRSMAIGFIFFIIGILIMIPGVVLLSTFTCYSKDFRIRSQKFAPKMQPGFQAQIQTGPVIVAN